LSFAAAAVADVAVTMKVHEIHISGFGIYDSWGKKEHNLLLMLLADETLDSKLNAEGNTNTHTHTYRERA